MSESKTIRALAVHAPGALLSSFEYGRTSLGADEIEVKVEYCALCHSDLHLMDGDWACAFPFVPGHEIIGSIIQTGVSVRDLKPGQRVGIGWQCGSCGICEVCITGRAHLCEAGKKRTCVNQYGGFAEYVRAHQHFVYAIPETIPSVHAAPLMCAGLTVFSALQTWVTPKTRRIGIIGMGGLGHLAVQFAARMGCEVTAFDLSEDRLTLAKELGAHQAALTDSAPKGTFDLMIAATAASLDWNHWLRHLTWGGVLCLLGYPAEEIRISPDILLDGQKIVTGSVVGSPETMRTMLDFAARHHVRPMVEELPMKQAHEAVARLRANKVRYRMVLKADWE